MPPARNVIAEYLAKTSRAATVRQIAQALHMNAGTVQNKLRELEDGRQIAVIGTLVIPPARPANLWAIIPPAMQRCAPALTRGRAHE